MAAITVFVIVHSMREVERNAENDDCAEAADLKANRRREPPGSFPRPTTCASGSPLNLAQYRAAATVADMKAQPPSSPHRAVSRLASFRHAFSGWWYVLCSQRNAWIHALASVAVFALALWLPLGRIEWAILILTVALVWVAEFVNTAVEAVVDLSSPNIHPLAKIAKDVAAASVLIAALSAVVVGVLLLGPLLWSKWSG